MADFPEWRLEEYSDEMDVFALPQFYVMHGNMMIAHCEIRAHAVQIIAEHQRLERYERVLELIARLSPGRDDLAPAIEAALLALEERDQTP